MSTEQTLTPADEIRAAAALIRKADKPIVTCHGRDIGRNVEVWLDATARDMDANPGMPTLGWDDALAIARAVNRQVTA